MHHVEAGEVGAGDRPGLAGGGRARSPRAAPARRQPPAASWPSPGSGRGRSPAAPLSARSLPGLAGPPLPAPLRQPPPAGTRLGGSGKGGQRAEGLLPRGAGCCGQPPALCECESVGRVPWGGRTQAGPRCWSGGVSRRQGKSAGGSTTAEEVGAGRRSRAVGKASQGRVGRRGWA